MAWLILIGWNKLLEYSSKMCCKKMQTEQQTVKTLISEASSNPTWSNTSKTVYFAMSLIYRVVRKPDFFAYIRKQRCRLAVWKSNSTADQSLCFCHIDGTIPFFQNLKI